MENSVFFYVRTQLMSPSEEILFKEEIGPQVRDGTYDLQRSALQYQKHTCREQHFLPFAFGTVCGEFKELRFLR